MNHFLAFVAVSALLIAVAWQQMKIYRYKRKVWEAHAQMLAQCREELRVLITQDSRETLELPPHEREAKERADSLKIEALRARLEELKQWKFPDF